MADIEADPNQGSLDGEPGVTNKEKLADSTTQDSSSSDGKNGDTNGVVSSSTSSSLGSSQSSSGVTSTQTVSSPLIPPSRLTFCRPSPSSLTGFSATTSNPILGASKMMPNPFAITTQSSEGIIAPSRFGLSRQPGPDSTNFKSAGFKSGPLFAPSRLNVQSQNVHSLIKPATLPDPTNKNSFDKDQAEKSDADSSSSKPSSETPKEAVSSDNTTSRLAGVEAGSISSTTTPGQNESSSPSKFSSPAFSRLGDNNENKLNTSNAPASIGVKESPDAGAASSTPSSSGGEFVFGTVLHRRVGGIDDNSKKSNNCSGFVFGEKLAGRIVAADKPSSPPSSDHCLANSGEEANTPDFKSVGFKTGPLLTTSRFNVQSQNVQSLIKPATLPDPTNKNSFDKDQAEKSDADSSSSKPSSETPKEAVSSDNTTSRLAGVEAGSISSTTTPGQNESSSPSKFSSPAFSRLGDNNENKLNTSNAPASMGVKESPDAGAASSTPSSSGGEFVFGTNLHRRVRGLDDNSKKSNNCSGFVFGEKLAGRIVAADKPSSPPSSDHCLANSGEGANTPDFKSVGFKTGPILTTSRFNVQSQNVQSLIKPATLPDPTNKNSFDKDQAEKSDADSSSSKPSSETPKEAVSSDNTTSRLAGVEAGSISSTTTPGQNESSSPSKFSSPAFSRLSESSENKKLNTSNAPASIGLIESSDAGAASSTPSSSGGEFVFGTNLHRRIVGIDDNSKKSNNCSGFVFGEKLAGRIVAADKPSSPPSSDHCLANSGEEANTPDFKSVAFKTGPLLSTPRFNVQSENFHSLIKPATLPDPTNKNSFDKDQAEKSDADSSSSKPSSETPKEAVSSDNTTNRLAGVEAGSISSTTTPGQNESSSPSKFSSPAFSSSSLPNAPSSLGVKESSDGGTASTTPSSSGGEFLFGTNLHRRVVGIDENSKKSNNCSGFVFGENLANRVVAADKPSPSPTSDPRLTNSGEEVGTPEKQCQSLEESAREYQAKHGVRPEYKEIEVKTGEEDESNVLQCKCKLFVFDKPSQMWIERGCGVLRLNDLVGNDSEKFQSRIVMRSQGSLRVILNTKIWTGMTVERASQKTVRITAADGDGIKVFLIVANPKDSDNILRAIDWRIQQLKTEEEEEEEQVKQRGTEKRKSESQDWISPNKKLKKLPELSASISSGESKSVSKEESDSSVLDPETEASNESYTSSQTVRSESD